MTASAPPQARSEVLIFAVLALVALAALAYLLSQRQQELRASPVGMDGLQLWLTAEGGSAQGFSGGWNLDPASIGVLVLPLHDTVPDRDLTPALTTEELLFQQDENDLEWREIEGKLARVPTLIVLPKWRSGMRLTGIAHPVLLVDTARLDALLLRLTGDPGIGISRSPEVFAALPYKASTGADLSTAIYAAQLFDGSACTPVIGSGTATLLASCPLRNSARSVFILSDPDLLNNHGLRLGQNAAIARDFLLSTAGDDVVLIDYSRDNWFATALTSVRRDRTWADLLRFLEPPFRVLWIGAGLMLALTLWRSLRRAGPVQGTPATALDKLQAIRARARLMRLTGQDGALLADYAAARIAATAARLVGPGHARQIGEERAFLRHVARRRADLAERLEAVLAALHALPTHVPVAAAIGHVEDLEQILERIAHDT
ncbi:MAG: hypothetical protein B7Y02_00445 [Rhodobacterales bacterium 17-64-5]|nr:MAG: hypothetical protein B7Y02_00445 [Rhodobacterales bacterium 17-64-5]